jgi:hypothetical protein
MLISCGAALFGLRLAVRSLGYLPVVELLPDPACWARIHYRYGDLRFLVAAWAVSWRSGTRS